MSEAELRERIDYLEAENANLRELLAVEQPAEFIDRARRRLRIMPGAARLLYVLLNSSRTSKLALYHAYCKGTEEGPEPKVVDVQVCHLRRAFRRLRPDIEITTLWGEGYRIDAENRAKVYELLGMEAA